MLNNINILVTQDEKLIDLFRTLVVMETAMASYATAEATSG